jgi:hypothetical protein
LNGGKANHDCFAADVQAPAATAAAPVVIVDHAGENGGATAAVASEETHL